MQRDRTGRIKDGYIVKKNNKGGQSLTGVSKCPLNRGVAIREKEGREQMVM